MPRSWRSASTRSHAQREPAPPAESGPPRPGVWSIRTARGRMRRQRRRAERGHRPESGDAEIRVEPTRAERQQRICGADGERAVEGLRGRGERPRHRLGDHAHRGEVQQREGEPMEWLDEREGDDLRAHRHHRPAQDPGCGSERRGRSRSRRWRAGPITRNTTTSAATDSDQMRLEVPLSMPPRSS